MLTFVTTAKPFQGHSGIIQRNALQSWKLLHPDVEIVLFGDDEGAAEVCVEYGIRHEPHVERNEHGTKRLDYIFDRAQEIARHDTLCYVNCDIILMADFYSAAVKVQAAHAQFLMVGRRWDTDITEPVNFSAGDWQSDVIRKALVANHRQTEWFIDYFAFSRGLYLKDIPPLVIGRVCWDNWLIWRATALGVPVVDASAVVLAVHQNHDYGYHPQGKLGVWNDRVLSMIYSAADVFALPVQQDNLPNTALEAMACGLPVVAFASGGVPEMIRDGVEGRVVPPGDVAALRLAISATLQDRQCRTLMASNARNRAVREYGIELQAQRYLELYRRSKVSSC